MRRHILLSALCLAPVIALAQTYPSTTDPRANLKPGRFDAGEAASGMKLVSATHKPIQFDTARGLTFANSDMAFAGNLVVQGNFAGFTIWDVSNAAKPTVLSVTRCFTSQGDPSIVGNLLFVSAEGGANRVDCGGDGVKDPKDHFAGVRIFDISHPEAPKLLKNVQTCKGSHTHTVVPSTKDKNVVYLYVSAVGAARPATELAGCKNGDDPADTTNSLYALDIIKVNLKKPADAAVIPGGGARIFTGLDPLFKPGERIAGGLDKDGKPNASHQQFLSMFGSTTPKNCHDVTAYPALHLLAGSCLGYGIMVDISNPEKPVRLSAQKDTNFSAWHTAIISNDGKKVIFTDEWGGGTGPMCQAGNMLEMGGNAVLTLDDNAKKITQHAYFKLPAAQTDRENCVSHNGGLVPIPGRDVMVQGWYQGGVDVFDFTDADHPKEIAYFDRGPLDFPAGADVPAPAATGATAAGARRGNTTGGSWGAYYWNGHIYSSEIDRGFDVMELQPTENLSKNEIEAAKLINLKEYNPQSQPKIEWPGAFPVVRSFLDQLVRNQGLAASRTTAINAAVDAAEQQAGSARRNALSSLARQVDGDVASAKDSARVKMLVDAIRKLASATK
jgi:hypothetical protein